MDQSEQTLAADTTQIVRNNKRKLRWGLICLIAPTVLLIFWIATYVVSNFAFTSTQAPTNSACTETTMPMSPSTQDSANVAQDCSKLFDDPPAGRTIINIVLFLVGALVVITWLPGIIIGIILLATRKPLPPSVTIK